MSDGQVIFEIKGDASNVNQTVKQVTNNIESESRKWDKSVKGSADDMGSSFSALKLTAAGAFAAIGAAVIKFGSEAVEAASELREVQNVVDTVFGDSANQIDAWAKKAGSSFGLSETQAKKFTSTLGAMMKSSGVAGKEIVGMSTNLAGLAADMASFYNLDFDTAFEKIRSGISGQSMPLKQLGIDMSVANLNAFALAQGLEKTFDQMDSGEQTMLRYQYLMSVTADAQGDFERTSDGFANAQRRITSSLNTISTIAGDFLLNTIEPLVSGVAGFLETMTNTPDRTVLDDFNAIDIETDKKLGQIAQTAEEARILIDILDEISGFTGGDTLGKIADGANRLNASAPATWQGIFSALKDVDGLSNIFFNNDAGENISELANALSGSSVDTTKAEAWKTFLGALSDNADAVSKLTGESVDGTKEWLNGLVTEVNKIDPDDADAWDKLLARLATGLSGDTPEGKQFLESLTSQFLAMGNQSDAAARGLQSLGFTSDEITDKQTKWLETCKRLVETIPGLSSVINVETGEVKGGTQAIADYVDAWEKGKTRLAMLGALENKKSALQDKYGQLPGYELDVAVAKYRFKKAEEEFNKLYSEGYGQGRQLLSKSLLEYTDNELYKLKATESAWMSEEERVWNDAIQKIIDKKHELNNAEKIWEDQKSAYDEAVIAYGEFEKAIDEFGGDASAINNTADAIAYAGKTTDEWVEALKGAPEAVEAIKAVVEYYEKVRDATEQAVSSTIKGFAEVGKAGDELRKKKEEVDSDLAASELKNAKILESAGGFEKIAQMDAEAWKKLKPDIQDAYNKIAKLKNEQKELNESLNQYNPSGMKKNLEDQIKFMDEYLQNLEKLKAWGVSESLIAFLSDGSQESAEYLHGLVQGGEDAAKGVGEQYDKVNEKKNEFVNSLTQNKLAVDETYGSLVETAKTAMEQLDLGEEAADAMGSTVLGIAAGIRDKIPEVQSAVDSLIDVLGQLDSFGLSWGFEKGSFLLEIPGVGEYATGLDYVPYNNFPAFLHEGEAVLTAEENRMWQAFKNQQPGMDYETLGGVMRDSIQPGGNVYLDGRSVGRVISGIQGEQYRTLQRSGWQS